MNHTRTMMTRLVPPSPASVDERARTQGALHALHVLPR